MIAAFDRPRLTRRQLIAGPALAAVSGIPAASFGRQATPSTVAPRLRVEPVQVRYDEPFQVSVSGVEPGTEVSIRASFLDGRARTWRSEATWIASEWGTVDCSANLPTAGDFDVADSMAFIWAASAGAQAWFIPSLFGATPVTFTAHINDQQVDTVTIEREMLPPDWPVDEIISPDLVATYIPPLNPSTQPAPAMIVIGGSEGGLSPHTGALLAMHGYATLTVAYFGIDPLPNSLTNIPLEYFGNAIAWLQSHPDVDAERIGMLGVSRGGEATLLVASHYPEIKAAISYVGSGIGIASPGPDTSQPAFTWLGEPVPFSNYWLGEPTEPAEIAVERINGPVVLIAGDADQLWNASFLARIAWDRLQEHDHPWPDQLLTYPGAGHAILPPYACMNFQRDHPALPLGGSPLADQIASVNAWRVVLNTLAWRFGPGANDLA